MLKTRNTATAAFSLCAPAILSSALFAIPQDKPNSQLPREQKLKLISAGDPFAVSLSSGYNRRYEQVPSQRIMCESTQDVINAVRYARDENLPFSIRSGGHCFGGFSQHETLVIDLRYLNQISVNTKQHTISVGAGAALGAVHGTAAKNGLLLSAGWCSDVGIGGQFLGGGIGFTSRFGGLLCDRISELTMVDAQGEIIHAHKGLNDDLLWASRGGGGSLGVLTGMTINLDKVPLTTSFNLVRRYSSQEAAIVLARWQRLSDAVDRTITSHCSLYSYPDSQIILIFSGQGVGRAAQVRNYLHELLGDNEKIKLNELVSGTLMDVMNNQILRSMKGSLPLYAKSHFVDHTMSEDACIDLVSEFSRHPFGSVFVTFETLGGAVSDIGNTETAFPHRNAKFLVQSSVQPKHHDKETSHLKALSAISSALDVLSTGGAYANYRDRELSNWAEAYWGENLPLLSAIKRKYDPDNIFQHAQSVPP
ncbi:MAG: FAD-binding oxidoreductase [Alphaproteobacteria bacterium]